MYIFDCTLIFKDVGGLCSLFVERPSLPFSDLCTESLLVGFILCFTNKPCGSRNFAILFSFVQLCFLD